MSCLAIIPARSGSKGLPDKNIKVLGDKPLIGWTIDASKESGCFDEIMVSTDSEEYGRIARNLGANVPFLRSAETSCDTASSWDMVREVLKCYDNIGKRFDGFCLLQPTSPFRNAEDIKGAFSLMKEKQAKAVVSVCECEHSPLWSGNLPDSLSMDGFITKTAMEQRQKQSKFFRLNGAIYLMDTDGFLKGRELYGAGTFAYIMKNENSVDIDSALDFEYAAFIASRKN
ncbi:MAG: acylneuraminate cytidylyltransferase family protein [Lachnospiraceae bacterium]|nr:acylneuraminate cytidylyltransferase family protein [Lachnospiraceae bacterium]